MEYPKISQNNWQRLKSKLKRKYNSLSDEELKYKEGEEKQLVDFLCKRLKRKENYIIFTLEKGLADIDNNRL